MLKTTPLVQAMILGYLVGCAADPAELQRRAGEIAQVEGMSDADKFFIVDCLLPGEIRRLGSAMTYLTARKPIKTSALDCETQGGEYTASSHATQTSALQNWLPPALSGDAEAQVYAGEIYENGQGAVADYNAAAEWYRKAAAQGNRRAQINLGYLYEKGLGVEKNLGVALEWYQKASGLEQGNIPYAATLNTSNSNELAEENQSLKTALQSSRDETRVLSGQLAANQRQLQQSQAELKKFQQEHDQTQARLAQAKAQGNAQEGSRLEKALQEKNGELIAQQQKVADLTSKLEAAENRAKQIAGQLQSKQTVGDEAQLKLLDAETRLASTEKQLLAANELLNEATQNTTQQAQSQQALANMQKQLAENKRERLKLQATITQLEAEKQKYEQQIQTLQTPATPITTAQKPVIEIIDPPVTLVRGTPTVTMRSLVKERDIVGKATDPSGIMSLLVNDVKNTLDDKGIFRSTVGIKGEKTHVSVVAINRNGMRESLDFLLAIDGSIPDSQRSDTGSSPLLAVNPWKDINLGQYYALIIGNNHYKKIPRLDTPANDARTVSKILSEKYGFKTQLLLDADRYQTLSAMNELRNKLTENDNLLIYYAGHGELDQVNMRGHWLPIDADAENSANWISTVSITDILNSMSAKHIMVVADSCYSGAMTRTSLARLDSGMDAGKKSEWLKAMLKAKSRTVLSSGGLQPVMDGGGGSHSVFANAFIKALQSNQGLLEGQELFRVVSASVIAIAANNDVEQVPQYAPIAHAGHEAGEFFFMPK